MPSIYVGNLNTPPTEQEILELFEPFGAVTSVRLALDRFTDQFRGFCIVVMENTEEANNAISALDKTDYKGSPLTVYESLPRTPKGTRGGVEKKRW